MSSWGVWAFSLALLEFWVAGIYDLLGFTFYNRGFKKAQMSFSFKHSVASLATGIHDQINVLSQLHLPLQIEVNPSKGSTYRTIHIVTILYRRHPKPEIKGPQISIHQSSILKSLTISFYLELQGGLCILIFTSPRPLPARFCTRER
jgi:hypothetical protein